MNEPEAEAGVVLAPPPLLPTAPPRGGPPGTLQRTPVEYRDDLVKEYYGGATGVEQKLNQMGMVTSDKLIFGLIREVLVEADHLLGNHLVAAHSGELQAASAISFKRVETLEKAIKALHAELEYSRSSAIDINSGAMITVFKYFMGKCRDALVQMGTGDEISDLFFQTFAVITDDWKKELQQRLEESEPG